ncbi:MAG: ATP-binding protein [Myxococcales bacterium]|nr:ATP-binding protein [Myxococcales bacterium]
MTLAEQLGVLVEREWSDRDNRRLGRLLKAAKIGSDACLEDVRCDPGRGLDRAIIRDLATGRWILAKLNVIVVGKTGVGKSYLGAALAQSACRLGHRALFTRVPRLCHDLAIARADGTYSAALARLARVDVLVLDDFLLAPMIEREVHDLLEILEDRYDRSSTVITSQIPTKMWHDQLLQPTLADAICDRLVHNAHVLALDGPSLREGKGPKGKKSKS